VSDKKRTRYWCRSTKVHAKHA